MSETTIGQIILFLTTLAGFAIQIYRENRKRKWDLEDREAGRREFNNTVASVVEDVKTQTTEQTRVLVKNLDTKIAKAKVDIEEEVKKLASSFDAVDIGKHIKESNPNARDNEA